MKRLATHAVAQVTFSAGKLFCPMAAFVPFCANSHCLVSVAGVSLDRGTRQCSAMFGTVFWFRIDAARRYCTERKRT